jgi:hypothetical protein
MKLPTKIMYEFITYLTRATCLVHPFLIDCIEVMSS